MKPETIIDAITRQDWLGTAGDAIQPAIIKAFEAGGETGQQLKNFLHGTWLGHPLHPIITDVPIGAWTAAAVLDCLELSGQRKYAPGADAAIAIGLEREDNYHRSQSRAAAICQKARNETTVLS